MDIIYYTLMVFCVIFGAWEPQSQMETKEQIFQISRIPGKKVMQV